MAQELLETGFEDTRDIKFSIHKRNFEKPEGERRDRGDRGERGDRRGGRGR